MQELIQLLKQVPDTYADFEIGVASFSKEKPSHLNELVQYIKNNSNLTSSDIVEFIVSQPDFFEDSPVEKVS